VTPPPRVVFDTNILFSSVGWRGNPYQCIQAARRGECLSLTCEPVLTELADKLRLKRGLDVHRAQEIADEIRTFSAVVAIPGTLRVIVDDPDDNAVLECAVVSRSDFLVSGDRHLLALGRHQTIRIVTATEFLTALRQPSPPHSA
jgi:putative PIN family toxin of toxin-antitoxin system